MAHAPAILSGWSCCGRNARRTMSHSSSAAPEGALSRIVNSITSRAMRSRADRRIFPAWAIRGNRWSSGSMTTSDIRFRPENGISPISVKSVRPAAWSPSATAAQTAENVIRNVQILRHRASQETIIYEKIGNNIQIEQFIIRKMPDMRTKTIDKNVNLPWEFQNSLTLSVIHGILTL